MGLIKINCKLLGASRGEVVFRVNSNVQIVALISGEWGDTSGCIGSIVVGKLHEQEEVGPVVLLVVAIDSEVLFKSLVSMFHLTVTFQVIT